MPVAVLLVAVLLVAVLTVGAWMAPIDIYRVISKPPPGDDHFFASKFDDSMAHVETYFLQFVAGAAAGDTIQWRQHTVFADELLTPEGLAAVRPGSVLLLASWLFEDRDVVNTDPGLLETRLLSTPRLWALLNASQPLLVVLTEDGSCSLDWPSTSHHVLYRATWCGRWHEEWEASTRLEGGNGSWPWLRSFPFGTYAGDVSKLEVGSRPAAQRPLLFSFRGHTSANKPSRSAMKAALEAQRDRLDAIAAAAVRPSARPRYPFGRYLLDVVGYGEGYATGNLISYADSLRQSVLALSPPGDLWEAYRTWEAIAAGSVPVLVNARRVHGCRRPGAHMLALTGSFALWVDDWSELPDLLAREAANLTRLHARQQAMRAWLDAYRSETRRLLLSTSAAMRRGRWKPRAEWRVAPLDARTLAKQHRALGAFWRRPQPTAPSLRLGEATNIFGSNVPQPLAGGLCRHASYEDERAFREPCKAPGCAPPMAAGVYHGANARTREAEGYKSTRHFGPRAGAACPPGR